MAGAEHIPILFKEHVQLLDLGISQSSIVFNRLTMESERFICVRENVNSVNSVVVVDLENPTSILRRPITADSAIMHPIKKVLALKSDRDLQVFDLEAKAKLASCQTSEPVVFWKWVSKTRLGLVTDTACFLWTVDPPHPAPVKVFERSPDLKDFQIINFRTNPDDTWMFVVGITLGSSHVVGKIQLYNSARSASQIIPGHAATFATLRREGDVAPCQLFAFAARTEAASRLHFIEIDRQQEPANATPYGKKNVEIVFPPEAAADFPVAVQTSQRHGIIFVVTKFGYVHLYDMETAVRIYMNRISGSTVFVTADHVAASGLVAVNHKSQVLLVGIDDSALVPYVRTVLNNPDLALRLASRCGLPGADDMYLVAFEHHFAAGNYTEAVKVAARSPNGLLRTPHILDRLRQVVVGPNQVSPMLQYFGFLLENGELNKSETLELARPIIAQGKKGLLEKWLKEDKLFNCEELGDMLKPQDAEMALNVYMRATTAPAKTAMCLIELGRYEQVVPFCEKANYKPDYFMLLQSVMRANPERGTEFAAKLCATKPPLVPLDQVLDVFLASNLIQQATAFLLDALKKDLPEQAHLQTRVIEINLVHAPAVADAILGNNLFTHYDRAHVAQLCEKAGLYQRALEHYTDIYDIKRALVHTHLLNPEWVVTYFGRLSVEQSNECLREMLSVNPRQNMQLCVQIAIKYTEQLGATKIMAIFEQLRAFEGLYYYLGAIVNVSQEPEVHFKYIQAACRTGQVKELERICRDSNYYDAEKVKIFLKEANLSDQLPLIIVCDRFNFVHDLVLFLYKSNQLKSIEVYVQKVNPLRTSDVVGALLDVGCDESVIKQLLISVRSAPIPSDLLIEEVEKRNRLKFLLPWLEMKTKDGSADTPIYNALAKIYIDSNSNAESFLRENKLYDPRIVGRYCEKRNPQLAFVAYQQGLCDEELINVTNKESMFKQQARYLIKRRESNLWANVLSDSNPHRRALVDQVVATALPESQDSDEVSHAVKAFLEAKLHYELMELLEKIVLENTAFSDNGHLQNLLIITAIQSNKGKVMDYINRLKNFHPSQIANLAIASDLFEEAFVIYKRCNVNDLAIKVLTDNIKDLQRAEEFAERADQPDCWSILARAQLDEMKVKEAIVSFVRVGDTESYELVTNAAMHVGCWPELVDYLLMARVKVREASIESDLLYCYAKTEKIQELEDFLSAPNIAEINGTGERCYAEGMYHAAKILFGSISNWARLSSTLVHLKEYGRAVECATKASSVVVWKEVHNLCLDNKEFKLAQVCGGHLVIHADELESLCKYYEAFGNANELMVLLEMSLGLERAHVGIFTELSILYTKYSPERLEDHLKIHWPRILVPKVIRATEAAHLWRSLVYLYTRYDEHDNAALTMMEHSATCFEHKNFKEVIVKARTTEVFYRAIKFYLEEQPLLINDVLIALSQRLDHSRVVKMIKGSQNIPLIKPYLISVLSANNAQVNQAYHELLIEEEDFRTLRDVVQAHDNYDTLDLAQRLSKHELTEFRRIGSLLYKRTKRWKQSIALSKKDALYRDAMETAAESRDIAVAEELLEYFVHGSKRECFAALLYTCYDMLRPDVVLEISWRHGWTDAAMPFLIQTMRDVSLRVESLHHDSVVRKRKDTEKERAELAVGPMLPAMQMPLMLPAPGQPGATGSPSLSGSGGSGYTSYAHGGGGGHAGGY